jgi:hypothetical protein
MSQVGVEPLWLKQFASSERSDFFSLHQFELRLCLDLWVDLKGLGVTRCLIGDHSHLSWVVVLNHYSLFNIIMFDLESVKALNSMISHCECLTSYGRHCLDESDHGLIAMSVKFVVISSFERLE